MDPADGVRAMVPRERMSAPARKLRDAYARVPGAPLYRREFGFYVMDSWKREGHVPADVTPEGLRELFLLDAPGNHSLGQLGWCEAAFAPEFEEKVLEDRGAHEVVQDRSGRHVLCFKGRRSGFMPEYLDHPVKDRRTWEEDVKPRLDPSTPSRWEKLPERMARARAAAAEGLIVTQNVVGGYMYLRSLIGPEQLFYAFYDMPDVIHDCMRAWLALAEAVTARHQAHVTVDDLYFGEDICYNHGLLISPEMVRAFIFPYYQQLVANIKSRQLDRSRHLYVQVDTDGDCRPAIPLYREAVGMDVMNPFEVASGCDVVALGREHQWLAMFGGIDKRILASGRAAIDRELERVIPAMRARGGYIPTCDHGVPEEVPFADYLHYRRRCAELGG
jgi:uroporphyrinogen decarboxylase